MSPQHRATLDGGAHNSSYGQGSPLRIPPATSCTDDQILARAKLLREVHEAQARLGDLAAPKIDPHRSSPKDGAG